MPSERGVFSTDKKKRRKKPFAACCNFKQPAAKESGHETGGKMYRHWLP